MQMQIKDDCAFGLLLSDLLQILVLWFSCNSLVYGNVCLYVTFVICNVFTKV